MTEIDAPAAPTHRLLERMIVLARLGDHTDRHQPQGILLSRILRQMLLFSRMTERLGIARPRSAPNRAVLRDAELGCLECATWRRCQCWLDGKAPEDDHRAFCPNEGLLAALPKQSNVNRPYAPE